MVNEKQERVGTVAENGYGHQSSGGDDSRHNRQHYRPNSNPTLEGDIWVDNVMRKTVNSMFDELHSTDLAV